MNASGWHLSTSVLNPRPTSVVPHLAALPPCCCLACNLSNLSLNPASPVDVPEVPEVPPALGGTSPDRVGCTRPIPLEAELEVLLPA